MAQDFLFLCFFLFSSDAMLVCSVHSLAWLSFWTCPWLPSSALTSASTSLHLVAPQMLVSHVQLYTASPFPQMTESESLSLPTIQETTVRSQSALCILTSILPVISLSPQATWSSSCPANRIPTSFLGYLSCMAHSSCSFPFPKSLSFFEVQPQSASSKSLL